MPSMKKAIWVTVALAVLAGCGGQDGTVGGTQEDGSAKAKQPDPMLIAPAKSDEPKPAKADAEKKQAARAPKQAATPVVLPKTTKKQAKQKKEVVNLIDNGTFGRWPSGQRVPMDWTHGLKYPSEDKMPSVIERLADKRYVAGMAAKQTWKRSDGADSVFKQFGITVTDLKPNTKYSLRVRAHNQSQKPVLIAPYGVDEDGKQVERLAQGGVQVKPSEGFKEYASGFATKGQTTVRLAAVCNAKQHDAYPVTVVWDEWFLFEIGPDEGGAEE